MSENDQQSRITTRHCSNLRDALPEEASRLVHKLSEALMTSDLQARRQGKRKHTYDLAAHFEPRNFLRPPQPDRLSERVAARNAPHSGSPPTFLDRTDPHASTEQLNTSSISDSAADTSLLSIEMMNRPLIAPNPLEKPSLRPPNPQNFFLDPAQPHMQALIEKAPSLGLDVHKCKDRSGGIVFDVLAPNELPDKLKEHGELFMNIRAELRKAITAHLGVSPEKSGARQLMSEFEQALYYRAREELRHTGQIQQLFRPVCKSKSLADDQLYCLLLVLREVDKMMREVDEADLPAFEACCKMAAMEWQIDIHKHWIAELTGERKRKDRDNEDSASRAHKHRRTSSVKSEGDDNPNAPKRRPGRPPGVRNKATVAAEKREAVATSVRDRSVALHVTPASAPRMRGLPLQSQYRTHRSNITTQQVMPSQVMQLSSTPTSRLMEQYSPQPGLQHLDYAAYPQNCPQTTTLVSTCHRRGPFSKQERRIDPDLRQQVEALSSPPQVYINHPAFNHYCKPPDQRGRRTPNDNDWIEDYSEKSPNGHDQKSK